MNPIFIVLALAGIYLFRKLSKDDFIKGGGGYVNSGYKRVLYWRRIVNRLSGIHSNSIPDDIILGIIAQESMGKHDLAIGAAGEIGVMQITPKGLSYSESGWTLSQIKNSGKKNIETGIMHLTKDLKYLGDINNAIMAYIIERDHIKSVLDGRSTPFDRKMVTGIGKSYLAKVLAHRKQIRVLLNNPNIDDIKHDDYIEWASF